MNLLKIIFKFNNTKINNKNKEFEKEFLNDFINGGKNILPAKELMKERTGIW